MRGPDQLRGGPWTRSCGLQSVSHVLTFFLRLSFLELRVKGDQKIRSTALNEITASSRFKAGGIRHPAPSRTGVLGCDEESRVLPSHAESYRVLPSLAESSRV